MIDAMKQALEALERIGTKDWVERKENAITTLRQAIEQAEKQSEPVAYLDAVDRRVVYVSPQRKRWLSEREDKEWRQFHYDHQHDTPLYTAPPSKPWVDLSDEQISRVWHKHIWETPSPHKDFARAIEATLKEKNT